MLVPRVDCERNTKAHLTDLNIHRTDHLPQQSRQVCEGSVGVPQPDRGLQLVVYQKNKSPSDDNAIFAAIGTATLATCMPRLGAGCGGIGDAVGGGS